MICLFRVYALFEFLLEMMKGSITVQSTYGKGSTFTITIPQTVLSEETVGNFKEKFEKSIDSKKTYHESFRAPDARILIVDDTRMNLLVATEFLRETQVRIDTASGGREAVELALKNPYDVILMDQRMPEMDGEEAFRRIRSHKDGPNANTPVICLTADAVVGARERYLSKGFNDYLTKPIDSTYLERMLKKYIPSGKIEIVTEEEKNAARMSFYAGDEDSTVESLEKSGIDTARGLENCARDEKFYLSILKEYVNSSDEKKADLAKYIKAKDLKNYEIIIHSIKSTSATIGADVPYKLAQKLESAAKENDLDYVLSNHEAFLAGYNTVLDAVRSVITDSGEPDDDGFGDDGVMEFAPDPD